MSGAKIDLDRVLAAEKVVDHATEQMNTIASRILAQAGASEQAILAPAGQISSGTYNGLGGGGKALSETLSQLRADLASMRNVAMQGSDQATQAARSGSGGSTVAQGM
jgi:hypothetical protein